jgi:hypothetical protein
MFDKINLDNVGYFNVKFKNVTRGIFIINCQHVIDFFPISND